MKIFVKAVLTNMLKLRKPPKYHFLNAQMPRQKCTNFFQTWILKKNETILPPNQYNQ